MMNDDDILILLDDSDAISDPEDNCALGWKVLIVDDEPAIHQATAIALQGFTFEGKGLNILSAYSGEAAKQIMAAHADIAFILLDVVMEANDTGLQLVQYIREDLENRLVRIILRTGQPGDAPEESVIFKYDINDYKLKVELTRQKLITTAISVLRSYRDLRTIEEQTQQLQQAQLQLIQQEKMSALGNLVAGVAHEINNPIGFLSGNIQPALSYIQDIFDLLDLYQEKYPIPDPSIPIKIAAIDLEFIRDDLFKIIGSMQVGIDRIRDISTSLRTFSRADHHVKQKFNIHHGIESAMLILRHRLKANENRPAITVMTDYGDLPEILCFPGLLNQVFMNILANAIDMFDEMAQTQSIKALTANPHRITIQTEQIDRQMVIRIRDNGKGMDDVTQARIFDHLFTTKEVGKGTGLGLAIARQIVEEKHGGKLEVQSELGQGTEFCIRLPIAA